MLNPLLLLHFYSQIGTIIWLNNTQIRKWQEINVKKIFCLMLKVSLFSSKSLEKFSVVVFWFVLTDWLIGFCGSECEGSQPIWYLMLAAISNFLELHKIKKYHLIQKKRNIKKIRKLRMKHLTNTLSIFIISPRVFVF